MITGNAPFKNKSYNKLLEENTKCEINFEF